MCNEGGDLAAAGVDGMFVLSLVLRKTLRHSIREKCHGQLV